MSCEEIYITDHLELSNHLCVCSLTRNVSFFVHMVDFYSRSWVEVTPQDNIREANVILVSMNHLVQLLHLVCSIAEAGGVGGSVPQRSKHGRHHELSAAARANYDIAPRSRVLENLTMHRWTSSTGCKNSRGCINMAKINSSNQTWLTQEKHEV